MSLATFPRNGTVGQRRYAGQSNCGSEEKGKLDARSNEAVSECRVRSLYVSTTLISYMLRYLKVRDLT